MPNSQNRIFLQLLDSSREVDTIRGILKSPLGLSKDIIKRLFENRFEELNNDLDEIKLFVAGIKRAKNLSSSYSLASYYPFLFAFHQHFNSSFRARQGKALEKIVHNILKNYCGCAVVPQGINETRQVLKELFDIDNIDDVTNLDADAVGIDSENNRSIILQLRSRDDTGGTTAKSSLVELLKEFLRNNMEPNKPLLYLVSIWDARNSQQRLSTIDKMYSSISDYINIDQASFRRNIASGIELAENVTIKMSYGTDELTQALYSWTGEEDDDILGALTTIVQGVESWDDLWLSYAIASFELESIHIHNYSNVDILNAHYSTIGIQFDFTSYDALVNSIDRIRSEMVTIWTEPSIRFNSPAEQALYIKDLLFLKACYAKQSV